MVRSKSSARESAKSRPTAGCGPSIACCSSYAATNRSTRCFSAIWKPTASTSPGAIYHDNKKDFPEADTLHGAARLTEAVQRLIDRLVFMRVCEDRGIRQYGSLKKMLDRISAEGGEFYPALCAEFRQLDREYNGYLYKYHFSESLAVSDDILADFIRTLYPPDGPWDFSAIGDDILGIVYERFLGNIVVVKLGEADVEQKPEVRHANGVYYTPRFVVDTIIRRVVGPKIAGRSPTEVLDVKNSRPGLRFGLVPRGGVSISHRPLPGGDRQGALPGQSRPPRRKSRKKRKDIAFQGQERAMAACARLQGRAC